MEENGHLTSKELAGYWQRALPPATLVDVSDHLQICARCREALREARPATAGTEPVRYEDLVGWMEDDLEPERRHEIARKIGHPPTDSELRDLVEFRDEMNALPAQEYSPMALPPASKTWTRRLLAVAAGLLIGYGVLWTASSVRRAAGLELIDHGKAFTVKADGKINGLGPIPPQLQQAALDAVLRDKIDPPPFWNDLRTAPETLAGAPAPAQPLRVIAPVGVVVESARPVFHWSDEPGATGYRVNFVTKAGAVTSSSLLAGTATSWTPNESLAPNQNYEWEVEAWRGDTLLAKAPAPPAPEAHFRVIDPATRSALQQLLEKSGGSHLLMGLAYAQAGLQADAQRELEAFASENPQSPLPKNLLSSLGSW